MTYDDDTKTLRFWREQNLVKATRPEESRYPDLWEGLHDPFGKGGIWHKDEYGRWALVSLADYQDK